MLRIESVCAHRLTPLSEVSIRQQTAQTSFRPSDYVRACSFEPEITWLLYSWVSTAIYFAYKLFLSHIALQRKEKVSNFIFRYFKDILSL